MNIRLSASVKILLISIIMIGMGSCTDKKDNDLQPEEFKRLHEKQLIESELLQREMTYAVLLPPEYETSPEATFPVVYLLHGYGDNETAWYRGGNIMQYIDMYRSAFNIPAIYVMPEGYNNYWVNRYNGSFNLMDYMVTELVPEIDRLYRTQKHPQSRAVMGYSMGGYGALILAARHPETFHTAIVLSMSFRTNEQYLAEPSNVFDSQWGSVFGGIGTSGSARLTAHFRVHSPFHFFSLYNISQSGQNYFIDCGDDEETLSITSNELHALLREKGVKHEYRMRNGSHNWDYWHKSLPEAFTYLSSAFRNIPYPDEGSYVEGTDAYADTLITLAGNQAEISFSVFLPPTYTTFNNYPVVYIIHDSTLLEQQGSRRITWINSGRQNTGNKDNRQETGSNSGWQKSGNGSLMGSAHNGNLFGIFSLNMEKNRLPQSIIVEIPYGKYPLDASVLQSIIGSIKENFSTYTEGKYAVLVGNNEAGTITAQLASAMPDRFNACLLFDASIPEAALTFDPSVAWYLDITDEGLHYQEYNSLYKDLRSQGIPHELRVRQGLPTYDSFIGGLDEACIFLNSQLKK